MNIPLRQTLLPLAALAAAGTSAPASALTLPFTASYSGVTQVVEVLNPTGPVLRFQTIADGTGVFDLGDYFSTDVIDMSTGAGTGTNRFVATNGDELFGSFSVQVIPTAVASILDVIGQAEFTGGTGIFSGASGSAQFTGTGEFTSETVANLNLTYTGSIVLVPEPASLLLLSAGLAVMFLRGRGGPADGATAAGLSGA